MATLTVFSAAGDGCVGLDAMTGAWTWASNRDGSNGTKTADYTSTVPVIGGFGMGTYCDGNNRPMTSRTFLPFDTSALGSGATISAGTINLVPDSHSRLNFSNYKNQITEGTQASTSQLVAADYTAWNDVVWSDGIANDSLSDGSYNVFTLNATGYGAINKTGYSKYCVRIEWDVANSPPGTNAQNDRCGANYRSSEYAGTSSDPYIEVTYTSSTIKTFNGVATASVKTVDGVAIASVKSWNGIT